MSIQKIDLERRRLLLKTFYGGISSAFALEYLTATPLLGSFLAERLLDPLAYSLDAFPLISDAIRGGSSILKVHQAMALDSSNDWSIVTIKVVNHVLTPLVFGLGKIADDGSLDLGVGATLVPDKSGLAKDYMKNAGVLKISDKPRYRKLRLNKWFADILHNGTSDGKDLNLDASNRLGVPSGAMGPFPTNVALQAALHLQQGVPTNHSIQGFKVRSDKPDLAKYIEDLGILKSPLGISCFMMGNNYDKAEGTSPKNIICSASKEVSALDSRTVAQYVSNISQNLSSGYNDTRKFEDNITAKIDLLARGKSSLRNELIDSRAQFKAALASLGDASILETRARQSLNTAMANSQTSPSSNAAAGAGTEFLGQCLYTARAISGLAGTPLRNFSLFLNTNDLDKKDLDVSINTVNADLDPASLQSLCYIEGMRQLAMGLNILAQPIAAGKKVIVQVLSEGGRKRDLGDNQISFMFVMGPEGTGLLTDNLMANSAAIDMAGGKVVQDPGEVAKGEGGSVPWTSDELREENGTASPAGSLPSVGDMQMGIIRFLADITDQNEKIPLGTGRYVRFKRG